MNVVSVRPAAERNLADIPRIELAAAGLFSEDDLPLDIRYRVTAASSVREALDQQRLWVAMNDDEAVGFAMAGVVDGQAYLEEVDVLPQYGGQGIGTQLVQAVIAWARTQSYDRLLLVTFRHLPWNAPFYKKLGFELVDRSDYGDDIRRLMDEEGEIGIDVANRVVMEYSL